MIRLQTCPICNQELTANAGSISEVFPFCSHRCRQVDFHRWCSGRYAIVEPLDPSRLSEEEAEKFIADNDAAEEEWR